ARIERDADHTSPEPLVDFAAVGVRQESDPGRALARGLAGCARGGDALDRVGPSECAECATGGEGVLGASPRLVRREREGDLVVACVEVAMDGARSDPCWHLDGGDVKRARLARRIGTL